MAIIHDSSKASFISARTGACGISSTSRLNPELDSKETP